MGLQVLGCEQSVRPLFLRCQLWSQLNSDGDLRKRIFLLGPSHHFYLSNAALSGCDEYATPMGNLIVDRETTVALHKTGQFSYMSQSVDEDEHSLEMHLPFVHKMLSR